MPTKVIINGAIAVDTEANATALYNAIKNALGYLSDTLTYRVITYTTTADGKEIINEMTEDKKFP